MKHKTGWMAAMITIAAMAAQAQIANSSATVATAGSRNTIFPQQNGSYSGIRVVAQMRESDPTVMDVDYIVYTDPETTPTVNIRALAFEDGERGFATVVRPETFIEGTDANIGDGIAANVEHHLAWKVPSDWATDLAKVKFEVLAMKPGDLLLPGMHFVTIPAAEGLPKTIVSVNDLSNGAYEITRDRAYYKGVYSKWGWYYSKIVGHRSLLNALFWLYASGDTGLSLSNGVLTANNIDLVRHAGFLNNSSNAALTAAPDWTGHWSIYFNAIRYVFDKMGYRLLEYSWSADGLLTEDQWVRKNLRLNLSSQGFRAYAVKAVEE